MRWNTCVTRLLRSAICERAKTGFSFASELANLMWFHDEHEARKMFSAVADDFVQLLIEGNARVNALGGMRDASDQFRGFGAYRDDRSNAIVRMHMAREVREQIALAIGEHDAELGYEFVNPDQHNGNGQNACQEFYRTKRNSGKEEYSNECPFETLRNHWPLDGVL